MMTIPPALDELRDGEVLAPKALPLDVPGATPALVEQRLRHLFRHAVRAGQINPLMHMLPSYRRGDPR